MQRVPNSTLTHVSASPPFHPGRSVFPSPVGDLDPLVLFPIGPSQSPQNLSANSHTPLGRLVYPTARHPHEIPPGFIRLIPLDAHQDREPLCPFRVYPEGYGFPPYRKALPSPHRSYGLMRQTNILYSTSPLAILSSLRRLPLAPAGSWPFPTLSPQSLHGCLDPYPVAFSQCTYPFLPGKLRPHYRTE
jgi:hypothetical protein